jgi:hypothetical protein
MFNFNDYDRCLDAVKKKSGKNTEKHTVFSAKKGKKTSILIPDAKVRVCMLLTDSNVL